MLKKPLEKNLSRVITSICNSNKLLLLDVQVNRAVQENRIKAENCVRIIKSKTLENLKEALNYKTAGRL